MQTPVNLWCNFDAYKRLCWQIGTHLLPLTTWLSHCRLPRAISDPGTNEVFISPLPWQLLQHHRFPSPPGRVFQCRSPEQQQQLHKVGAGWVSATSVQPPFASLSAGPAARPPPATRCLAASYCCFKLTPDFSPSCHRSPLTNHPILMPHDTEMSWCSLDLFPSALTQSWGTQELSCTRRRRYVGKGPQELSVLVEGCAWVTGMGKEEMIQSSSVLHPLPNTDCCTECRVVTAETDFL